METMVPEATVQAVERLGLRSRLARLGQLEPPPILRWGRPAARGSESESFVNALWPPESFIRKWPGGKRWAAARISELISFSSFRHLLRAVPRWRGRVLPHTADASRFGRHQ